MRNRYHHTLGIIGLATVMGCSHQHFTMPDDPRFSPAESALPADMTPIGGSIYMASDTSTSLFQDIKAHRVGDILTVKLKEKTSASKDADASFKKEYKLETPTPPSILGFAPHGRFLKDLPFLKSEKDRTLVNAAETKSEFKGEGDASQNNSMDGEITVTVSQILPNNNLVIRGEKWLTLNQGSEYIRLTGIVRPQDVSPDNEISSNKIADARITYSGKGTLANSSNAGWIAKFFNGAWYPF